MLAVTAGTLEAGSVATPHQVVRGLLGMTLFRLQVGWYRSTGIFSLLLSYGLMVFLFSYGQGFS